MSYNCSMQKKKESFAKNKSEAYSYFNMSTSLETFVDYLDKYNKYKA